MRTTYVAVLLSMVVLWGLQPVSGASAAKGPVRIASEGQICFKVASTSGNLNCINTHAGLRWQKPLTYQEEACDPNDPRIAEITLPPEEYGDGYIAAACVALDWLERESVSFPQTDVYVPSWVSAAGRASIRESAGWQLRFLWGRHTFKKVTPSAFIFDSKRFLCTKNHSVLLPNFYVYRECDLPPREWSCEDNPGTANGAPPNAWAGKKQRAGFIGFSCSIGATARVNPFKFYLGMLSCDKTSGGAVPLCYDWSKGAYYIFGNYLERLGEAEKAGTAANLDICASGGFWNFCPQSPLLFRRIIPSSNWLTLYDTYCDHGSDPYGEGGNCSAAEHFGYVANGYAFEWVVAHYGLDAAYGLIPATQAAKRNKTLYLKILDQYFDISTTEFFAQIDEYVTLRLQGRVR